MANNKKQKDEKTMKFIKNFIAERESGLSIPEIADKYFISKRHAYNLLQEIADANGVTRESLLHRPNAPHASPLFVHRNGEEKVNIGEIRKEFQNIITSSNNIISKIDSILEEDAQWQI